MALSRITKSKRFNITRNEDGNVSFSPCTANVELTENEVVNVDITELPMGSLCTKPHTLFSDLLETISQTKPTVLDSDIRIYEKFVEERVGMRLQTTITNVDDGDDCNCFKFNDQPFNFSCFNDQPFNLKFDFNICDAWYAVDRLLWGVN